jgi:hypothetical protein
VSSRRAMSTAEKRFAIEGRSTAQGRQEDVVREILDLVSHAAVSPRDLDEGLPYGAQGRHRGKIYHPEIALG